jgi:hypothetical protein
MPYVYEGDAPTRVNGVRYAPGSTTDSEDVKGKPGFKEVSQEELDKLAADRPGGFADAKEDAWKAKFGESSEWMAHAGTSAVLNRVIGDDEAPYGPPSGTITTKQAVMRDPEQRPHFGDLEWTPEEVEERKLNEMGSSGEVQYAQGQASGKAEKVAAELIEGGEGTAEAPKATSKRKTSSEPSS